MGKLIDYAKRIYFLARNLGLKITAKKVWIDFTLRTGTVMPSRTRWQWAHEFHTAWKGMYLRKKGYEEYAKISDETSIDTLNNFYETGTDFSGLTFVDVGCGTRGLIAVVQARHKIGVDPLLEKIPYAELREVLPAGCYYRFDKGEQIGLPDHFAEVVACNNVLNHVEDPEKVIKEMHRLLKPGGRLLLQVFIQKENIGHTHSFTPAQIDELLQPYFEPLHVAHEKVCPIADVLEEEGEMPMCYGGVYRKRLRWR